MKSGAKALNIKIRLKSYSLFLNPASESRGFDLEIAYKKKTLNILKTVHAILTKLRTFIFKYSIPLLMSLYIIKTETGLPFSTNANYSKEN